MTARDIFEAVLTEVSKTGAPSLLLQDFNYFFNKAIGQYINKQYNIYDVNQQTTDSLRVLKATTILPVTRAINDADSEVTPTGAWSNIIVNGEKLDISKFKIGSTNLFGATYEVFLPDDYLHMLNCVCIYKLTKDHLCYDKDNFIPFSATRLTADTWSAIINDFYKRPLPERPYYYIHNINKQVDEPTDLYDRNSGYGTDQFKKPDTTEEKHLFKDKLTLKDIDSTEEEVELRNNVTPYIRHANASKVRCEIRYGYDSSVFELVAVQVDYVKAPQKIRLTQEQVNKTEDTSQVMEFPDYVCNEIINELVTLVMENSADPRLQTHIPVTQSIANPAQQQTQPQPQARPQG